MISLAFKMLIGKKASCIGVIFGIFLATLLISQQSAIFLGLMARSYRIVTDTPEPTIWVMDPATESEDKLRSMPLNYLDIVRKTPGIDWAVPLSSTLLPITTPSGKFDITQLYGVDDATLIGAPSLMLQGSVKDLRRSGGIIVDEFSARGVLSTVTHDGVRHDLQLGETLEINGKRAVVVGICKITQNFYPQPIIYTSFSEFQIFNPGMTYRTGFILAKTNPSADIPAITKAINEHPGLRAYSREEFKNQVMSFFLKTGVLINFGLSVILGIIIGFSISGQIFYMMTLENITYYALIKAVGGTGKMILKMIIFQAAVVGIIGFSLGMGLTVLWGLAIKDTTLAFLFPWQLLLFSGGIVLLICIFTAILSAQKVFKADPKILMGT
ncbi:MAG: ABC transporter permease [Parachlamydiaceae bacterium]|nr:ABC transporter permease [Parachlamydiaceae bacterium]